MNKVRGDLLSHTVTRAVPSAQEGLTSEFGMGSGVTLPLSPPELLGEYHCTTIQEGETRITSTLLPGTRERKEVVKPHDRLVRVSLAGYPAYTSRLSTSWSTRGL